MALTLNNTSTPQNITSGFISPSSVSPGISGTQTTTPFQKSGGSNVFGAQGTSLPPQTTNSNNILPPQTGISGLLSPHASLASNLSSTGGSHTITDTMGNTSTVKVNPPAVVAPDDPSNQYNTSTGQLNPNYTGNVHEPGTPGNGGATGTQVTPSSTLGNVTTPSGATVDPTTGGLVSAPATAGNPYTAQVANSAGQNAAIGQNAANIAAQYGKQIADVGQQGANAQSGYLTTGTTPVATGNAGVIAQNVAAQQSALASGESAALQGTGQQLTAQGQQTSGLASAAGLAQPSGSFPFVFNPTTGTFSTPAGTSSGTGASGAPTLTYNPQQDASNFASDVISGKIPYSDAVSAMGYATGVGTGLLQTAITNQGGNLTQLEAQTSANQQNTVTGGTSDTQTAASGYASILPQYQQATTDFSTADKQASNLLSTLNQTGINSSNATDYNTTINGLASKLGSTQTTAFTTALTEAQQAYTKLLSSVGAATPTVNGEAATAVLNPSSTPAQIAESIDKLNQAAYAKLAPQYQQALTYYNQLHGTTATAIPGYPAPTLPVAVGSTPQGPDTSATTLGQAGVGAAVNTGSAAIGEISAFAKSILGLLK